MATRVTAVINHITREVLFEQSGVSSVELDGGLWTVVFKMPQYFGQKGSLPLTNANYAVTVNYSQNNPLLNDDGYTDHIDTIEVIEDASWEDGKYAQFEWTLPAEASLKNGWLYFNVRIRDRQTNGIWATKAKKIRVNPVVTGGSSSSLTPTQSDKIDELLDAYPVAYGKEQSLSTEEKYRARTNMGAFGSNSDPVPIRLYAEKTWLDIDEHNGWVTFLRGPYPQMLSSTYGRFDKPLAETATRIFNGSPVVLEVRSNAGQSVLSDICKTSESIGDISNVLFYPTSVNGNFGPTSDFYPDNSGWLLYQEDDATLSVRFECHDPIVYKNVAVAKYKEYTYTPRDSSTSITENFLIVEFSHEDLESVVVTVSGTNNSVASMTAFEIFEAVQNGKNVVLRWPMPNFNNGYYSCKLENSYKSGTAQANAWFTTIIGNDLHWYKIDGDGNARASTVVPIGGGSGSSVVKVIIGDDGTLPSEYPTVRSILDEIRAGRSVVGYWWMSNQHLEDESYVLVYPTAPILGQQENLELTGTYWNGEQRRMVIMSGKGADDTFTISFVDIPSNNTSDVDLSGYRTASAQDAIDAEQDTAIAAKYTKPSGGIPASDLASAVQTSLGKADTALQSAPVTSVNNKTGAVTLDASDVHALPDSTVIPSVPQMATQANMSDWTSGKTVDAAVLKNGVQYIERTIEGKADASDIPTAVSELTNDSGFVNASEAAAAAPVTSVNNKTGAVTLTASDVGALPDSTVIPPTVTEQTVSGWGFTKNTGTYSKPSGGIPASDLAPGVIPSVPQMATNFEMEDWSSGKTVDAAVLQTVFSAAGNVLSIKANASDVPDASTSAPVMDGTAAVGTSTDYARADHVHPSDTTRLATTGNAYRSASIPMGHLDATSTATVMTATVDGITELRDGVCMWLGNGVITSASGFTLNVNGLGAKPCYSSLAAESRSTTIFNVNYALLMIYNSTRVEGGCWDIVYGVDTNTTYTPVKLGFGYGTCTTAAATAAKTASISSYALTTGGIVSILFSNDVPANATLNVSSKGAKAIHYRGAAITAGVIKAGDVATFVYSTYYHLISIDRWGEDIADLNSRLDAITVLDEEVF